MVNYSKLYNLILTSIVLMFVFGCQTHKQYENLNSKLNERSQEEFYHSFQLNNDFWNLHSLEIKDVNGYIRPMFTEQHKYLKYDDHFKKVMKPFFTDSIYSYVDDYDDETKFLSALNYRLIFTNKDYMPLFYNNFKVTHYDKFYSVKTDNSIFLKENYEILQDSMKIFNSISNKEETVYNYDFIQTVYCYSPKGKLTDYAVYSDSDLLFESLQFKKGKPKKLYPFDSSFKRSINEIRQIVYNEINFLSRYTISRDNNSLGKFWYIGGLNYKDKEKDMLSYLVINDETGEIITKGYKNQKNDIYKISSVSDELTDSILKLLGKNRNLKRNLFYDIVENIGKK